MKAKLADRTGKCIVTGCKCDSYLYQTHTDGFDFCECVHTQWSHEKVSA